MLLFKALVPLRTVLNTSRTAGPAREATFPPPMWHCGQKAGSTLPDEFVYRTITQKWRRLPPPPPKPGGNPGSWRSGSGGTLANA